MKKLKLCSYLILIIPFFCNCTAKQEPRRPISHASGEFMKQSVERNKELNKKEENTIAAIIKKDSTASYIASTKGYWYTYITQNTSALDKPEKGEIACFDYDVKDIDGNSIYTSKELKTQQYRVDKQNIMMGLRDAIKLMKKGEVVRFLFPSHMGYGYHGDNNKISSNQPLICTVSLNDIKKDTLK